jgi:hypothetical protein
MTELKPCPFCGGKAHIESDYSSEPDMTRYSIWHEFSGHQGMREGYGGALKPFYETPWYDTEEEAVEAWNTRTERKCHETTVYEFFHGCGECGYVWEYMYGIGRRERPNYCPNCGAKVVKP